MRILLGTESYRLPGTRKRPVIQNLGPGNIYVETDGEVTVNTGLQLVPGQAYEFPTSGGDSTGIHLIADQAGTDVRVIEMG